MFAKANKGRTMKGISFRSMTMAVIVAVLCSVSLLWAQTAEDTSACAPRIAKPRIMSFAECKHIAEKQYNTHLAIKATTNPAEYDLQNGAKITGWTEYIGYDNLPIAAEFLFTENGRGVWSITVHMRNGDDLGGYVLTPEILDRFPDTEVELASSKINKWIDTLKVKGYNIDENTPYRLYYFENLSSHFFAVINAERNGKPEEIVVDLYDGFIQDINPEWKTLEDLKKAQIDFKPAPMPEIPGF